MNALALKRALAPLRHRLQMMVARIDVLLADDAPGRQTLQLEALADEVHDGGERPQNYGFTSVPLPGAEGVMVAAGGLRSHGLVLVVDDRRYRLRGLAAGEVAMHDDQGQKVHLRREGVSVESPFKIEAAAPEILAVAEDKITLRAPLIVLEGDEVHLGAEGGKKVARHDDAVVAGKVVATTSKVFAA